jgi:hypothetical protein
VDADGGRPGEPPGSSAVWAPLVLASPAAPAGPAAHPSNDRQVERQARRTSRTERLLAAIVAVVEANPPLTGLRHRQPGDGPDARSIDPLPAGDRTGVESIMPVVRRDAMARHFPSLTVGVSRGF